MSGLGSQTRLCGVLGPTANANGPIQRNTQDWAVGGEGGIRTHGTFRLSGFQDRRNRPLYHLSSVPAAGFLCADRGAVSRKTLRGSLAVLRYAMTDLAGFSLTRGRKWA